MTSDASTGPGPDVPGEDEAGDYSYDLAHDDVTSPRPVAPAPAHERGPAEEPTVDPDSDYSYDLAHEVPRSER